MDKTVNFATTYQEPLHALHQGQPVRLLATGDVEGNSPSFQVVNQSGQTEWVKASEITITDQRALPSGTDIQKIYQQGSRQPVAAGR